MKKPKQTGTQTVTQQMTLPGWLDSGFQDAAAGAGRLYNSGGNPAVAQAQSAYDSALSRYNSASSGGNFDYANNLPSDYTGIKDAGGGAYQWRVNPGTWQGGSAPMLTPGEIALYANNRGGGGGADRSEVDAALAALNAAKAQPWDQSQDPLWREKIGFSDPTQAGMDNMLNIANSGMMDPAFEQWRNTLEGDYLYGGDAFNAAQQAAANRIIPQVTSAFNSAGRMGGMAGQSELTGRLGDSFAGLYNAGRGHQMGALGLSPAMSALSYEPANRQLMVGGLQDAKMQEHDAIDYANKNIEAQRLDQYLQRLGGMSPNFRGETSERPVYSQGGGLGSLLGAGLSAAGMFSGNPWLGAAGGLGGGFGGGGFGMGPTGSMSIPGGGLLGGFQGF